MIIGGRLRSLARSRERQGGVEIMTARKDDTDSQAGAFDALRAELAGLRVMIPGVPSLPTRPVDYEGWFEDAFKRMQIRSEQRTLDEQNKILTRYDELYRQYLGLMKTTYDIVLKTHDFKRLGETVALDDDELKLKRRQIDIHLKELDLREAELDREIKLIREGKAVQSGPTMEDRIQQRILRIVTTVRTSAGLMAEKKKLQDEYPDEADFIDREIRKAIGNLRGDQ